MLYTGQRTGYRTRDTGLDIMLYTPGTGTGPGTRLSTDTGTDQGKSQNIYMEQD